MIELQNVSRRFRTSEIETTALNTVSMVVATGEFVSIMGPSGCGKSTLLAVLGMIDRVDGGSYQFCGSDVTECSERALAKLRKGNIGFVFQSFNLIDDLSVFENVELPLLYTGELSRAERREKVESMLSRIDMGHRLRHLPMQLSGGQQQRVAVARAIVTEPRLILADEPTGNLDSKNGEEIMDRLSELHQEGTTVIIVTHSEEAASRAHRTIRMQDGRLIERGT